ncbi:MAG: hypothetical protein RMK01_12990 [Thermomicrobium sp.]|nr:hypothetical protein [Thermomicrobium sp.]MDW8060975.1 hypothetical protein [Thermomicrobium sp.]
MRVQLSTAEGAALAELRYTNEGSGSFRWVPDRFRVTVEWPDDAAVPAFRLELPAGWRALPDGERSWIVFPSGRPTLPVELRVRALQGERARTIAAVTLPVAFCGRNRFDPERHRLPWANRIEELGEVEPEPRHFRATFRWALAPGALFRGLYRDVVGLRRRPDGSVEGGLCTGLSRSALAQALGRLDPGAAVRDMVLVLHGRQLSDRALLAGLPWFLFPSPRRAYRAFVRDLLERGWSDRCYDVNVPRPWRRDVVRALLGQGHTVVPYAFCQRAAERAHVWVYDPNLPDRPEATVVAFDLQRDRYDYPPLGVDGARTTVVAVPLDAYLRGRTAVLASLGNLLLRAAERVPRRGVVPLLVAAASILAALVLAGFRRRESGRRRSGRSSNARWLALRGASRSAAAGAAWASRR